MQSKPCGESRATKSFCQGLTEESIHELLGRTSDIMTNHVVLSVSSRSSKDLLLQKLPLCLHLLLELQ